MSNSIDAKVLGRAVCRPLSYQHREYCVTKELMVDYTNGKLYVVSADDRSVIFDVTQEILNLVATDVPGDTINVTINGETVNLRDLLNDIKNNGLQVCNAKTKAAVPSMYYDNQSLVLKDGFVQVSNYDKGKEYQVPYKKGNTLEWDYTNNIVNLETPTIKDSKITLESGKYYYSTNIKNPISIELKHTNKTKYSKILWTVKFGDLAPALTFLGGVKWEFDTSKITIADTIIEFMFETYDGGYTWIGKSRKYSNTSTPIQNVDMNYLRGYLGDYYTKKEIDDMFSWIKGALGN